ncbi:DNA-deoxyinosine glycosylase [Sphingomonas flavalba]|uniref:DNA-deoxyinosine glycosylase n=1 Tax=Sphingomonas flavalba TaxID=2559804 RepID=UPI00109DFA94|nr:DNA-deoxyinosine glycosylase [Sphingomonas flavalba]
MTREQAFPPVVDERTRLLILGSLPGRRSLDARQYYANPGNRFWALVGMVIAVDLRALAYPARLDVLRAHRIGLWDVIAAAERQGSLDSAIRNPELRDLAAMAATLPGLTTIAFNGVKAASTGLRQLGAAAARYRTLTLLSSSGACAVRAEVKQADWLRLRDCLT